MMRCSVLGVLVAGLLSGCSSAQTPPPAVTAATFVALAGANASVNDATAVAFPQSPRSAPTDRRSSIRGRAICGRVPRGGKSTRLTPTRRSKGRSAFQPRRLASPSSPTATGAQNIYVMLPRAHRFGPSPASPGRHPVGRRTRSAGSAPTARASSSPRDEPSIYRQQAHVLRPRRGRSRRVDLSTFGLFRTCGRRPTRLPAAATTPGTGRSTAAPATHLWSYEPDSKPIHPHRRHRRQRWLRLRPAGWTCSSSPRDGRTTSGPSR